MDKNLFIGDFRIKNCSPYGEFQIIRTLDIGDEVILQSDAHSKQIVVKKDVVGAVFGEIEMPDHIRGVVAPILQGKHRSDSFVCRISSVDSKQTINNRLRVSIWANKS